MRILMMTNTYDPIVGGIEQSIRSFSESFRKQGHKVIIVAPTFEGMNEREADVVRIPAIQNFFKEEVSLTLPIPFFLSKLMREFQPEIIHSHHFFFVGDMALRLSRQFHIPLVFTYHILLDQYADFFPIHNEGVKRFVIKLATGYSNLADSVIAPSRAVKRTLHRYGVIKPVHIIPTGIDLESFKYGNGNNFRNKFGIPGDAFLIGCVCRLNPEKNLEFLARSACLFLQKNRNAYCLIAGDGPTREAIKSIFSRTGLSGRLCCPGVLHGQELSEAYHALDVFVFASHSETQGLVLLEAMASGTPVVALDAPVIREFVRDRVNGRLITAENENEFSEVLTWFMRLKDDARKNFKFNSLSTAEMFSLDRCSRELLGIYENLISQYAVTGSQHKGWDLVKDSLKLEKDLLRNALAAAEAVFIE